MKVLFLNYEYPPLGGGAANATAYILAEWAKEPDIEAHLVTSALGDSYTEERIGERIVIHRIPIGKNPDELHRQTIWNLLRYSWSGFWFAHKLIRKSETRFDACLAFFTVPSGFQAWLLRMLTGLPYVVALRGSDVPGYNVKYTFLYPVLKPFTRAIWGSAKAVIANSAGLKELARETAPDTEIGVIPNGVDTEAFRPDPSRRPGGKFIVTPGASRITERKGLPFLVEAVALLKPKYPGLELHIMGDGAGRKEVEEAVERTGLHESVRFIGRVPREETARYYQEASAFVLPSSNEGMSNALLEGLASGLPAVVTDIGGTRELVTDGENGFIIPDRRPETIASALERLLSDSQKAAAMGAASRRVAESMGWNSVAREFIRALRA